MTEAEWLAADDPRPMLEFLRDRGGASERKLRLFAVACCRRVWDLLTDERSRVAVETAERYADHLASHADLANAAEGSRGAVHDDSLRDRGRWYAAHATSYAAYDPGLLHSAPPVYPSVFSFLLGVAVDAARAADSAQPPPHPTRGAAYRPAQPDLLRDLFGSPFRPAPPLAPAILAWNGGTVPKLAAAIYDERAFDRLPVLADALEDAGCADAGILSHCRGGGEHVRGCWVVDLMLGKA
jgi:hypothetical protein